MVTPELINNITKVFIDNGIRFKPAVYDNNALLISVPELEDCYKIPILSIMIGGLGFREVNKWSDGDIAIIKRLITEINGICVNDKISFIGVKDKETDIYHEITTPAYLFILVEDINTSEIS